jgi:hypothetical protein
MLLSFPSAVPRNALGPVRPTQFLPTAAAAPAWPRIRVADAKRLELLRKIIQLVLVASRYRQQEAHALWYGSPWLEIAALRARRPPRNSGVLLVDIPLQVLAGPVASGIGVPVPGPGVRRVRVVVVASKFRLLNKPSTPP